MDIKELKKRKREIDDELEPLYNEPMRVKLKRRLRKGNLMDRATVQRQFDKINKPVLKLEEEKRKITDAMGYLTDDDDIIKESANPPPRPEKKGASIGIPQMEQMNLFGVGGIFR